MQRKNLKKREDFIKDLMKRLMCGKEIIESFSFQWDDLKVILLGIFRVIMGALLCSEKGILQ